MKRVLPLVAALTLAACSSSGTGSIAPAAGASSGADRPLSILGGAPTAIVGLALYDAPIAGMPGVKVDIGIDGYQLITTNGMAVPFITNGSPQVVDLLSLVRSPQSTSAYAPLGTYSAVRMLIDSASSNVKYNDFTIPIYWGTPGNVTKSPVVAIDFPAHFAVTGIGAMPNVAMDFNVFQSVKFANGAIYVKPNVTASADAGQIEGTVHNAAGKNVANATLLAIGPLGEVVNSTFSRNDGSYTIHALPPGTYTIKVENSYTTATGETLTASNADAGAAPSTTVIVGPHEKVTLPSLTD